MRRRDGSREARLLAGGSPSAGAVLPPAEKSELAPAAETPGEIIERVETFFAGALTPVGGA